MGRYDFLLKETTPAPVANGKTSASSHARKPSTRPTQQTTDQATARPGDEPTNRPPDRVTTTRRIPVRRGFEFYEDQLTALKRMSLQQQMDGKSGSMSAMMRDALD
jgi:hypothetical protein